MCYKNVTAEVKVTIGTNLGFKQGHVITKCCQAINYYIPLYHTVQTCSGITCGRVLNGDLMQQRFFSTPLYHFFFIFYMIQRQVYCVPRLWVLVLWTSSLAKYTVKAMTKLNKLYIKLTIMTYLIILCRLINCFLQHRRLRVL